MTDEAQAGTPAGKSLEELMFEAAVKTLRTYLPAFTNDARPEGTPPGLPYIGLLLVEAGTTLVGVGVFPSEEDARWLDEKLRVPLDLLASQYAQERWLLGYLRDLRVEIDKITDPFERMFVFETVMSRVAWAIENRSAHSISNARNEPQVQALAQRLRELISAANIDNA